MGKEVFAEFKIALDGNFGENWTRDTMERFIVNNGGQVVDYRDEGMTHLLCTFKAFGAKTFAVREVGKRNKSDGSQKIKIVTFDWFEDSLQTRRKKAVTDHYDMTKAFRERAQKQRKRKLQREVRVGAEMTNFAKIVSDAKAAYNLQGYHCYVDPTGFTYDIELLRTIDFGSGGSVSKVVLRLFESDEPPFYYACYSTFVDMNGREAREVLANPASDFTLAFQKFKEAFEHRTKVIWEQRWMARPRNNDEGKSHVAFTYKQPEFGPLGMDLPPGRQHMAGQQQDEGDGDTSGAGADGDTSGAGADGDPEHDSYRRKAERVARANVIHRDEEDDIYHTADEGDAEDEMNVSVTPDKASSTVAAPDLYEQLQQAAVNLSGPAILNNPVSTMGFRSSNALDMASQFEPAQMSAQIPAPVQSGEPAPALRVIDAHAYIYGTSPIVYPPPVREPGIVTWDWSGRAPQDGSVN